MKIELDNNEKIDLIIDDVRYEIIKGYLGFKIIKYVEDFDEYINAEKTKDGSIGIDYKEA